MEPKNSNSFFHALALFFFKVQADLRISKIQGRGGWIFPLSLSLAMENNVFWKGNPSGPIQYNNGEDGAVRKRKKTRIVRADRSAAAGDY